MPQMPRFNIDQVFQHNPLPLHVSEKRLSIYFSGRSENRAEIILENSYDTQSCLTLIQICSED